MSRLEEASEVVWISKEAAEGEGRERHATDDWGHEVEKEGTDRDGIEDSRTDGSRDGEVLGGAAGKELRVADSEGSHGSHGIHGDVWAE
jgi:hypothetical protein